MSLWSCTSCSKNFSRKGDLTRHELLHTGIKPHICGTCGKGFAQFSGLKTHTNVHSKAKPYICGIGTCRKAFGDPSSCTRHRKETHRREGAYKCIVENCATKIKRRSTFAAHLRKHGFDTGMLDLDSMTLASDAHGIYPPARLVSSSSPVDDNCQPKAESQSPSPFVQREGFSSHSQNNQGGSTLPLDKNDLACEDSLLFQQASWYPLGGGAFSLVPTVLPSGQPGGKIDPTPSHESYLYSSGADNPFFFDEVFSAAVDYQLFGASPLQIPLLEPLLEVGSDTSRSSSTSPLSAFSLLYPSDSLQDTGLSPFSSNISQDLLLYNTV